MLLDDASALHHEPEIDVTYSTTPIEGIRRPDTIAYAHYWEPTPGHCTMNRR